MPTNPVRCWLCAAVLLCAGVAMAAPHKVRVNDPELIRSLVAGGARVIADYGSFQLIETEKMPAAGDPRLETADDLDVIELHARRLNTRAPEIQALRGTRGAAAGKRLHLVHFAGPIKPEWTELLEQGGVRIVAY